MSVNQSHSVASSSVKVNQDSLKETIRMLGRVLGETLSNAHGEQVLETVEAIRQQAMKSRKNEEEAREKLASLLSELTDDQMLIVARAFNHFLNLANIAEQFYSIEPTQAAARQAEEGLAECLARCSGEVSEAALKDALDNLSIELVFTAHPTEVSRRTLIQKHRLLNECLNHLQTAQYDEAKVTLNERVADLITQIWHSDEIREKRPTPVDEAKWGFGVIEQSLWEAVPSFMRSLHHQLDGQGISMPVSWMPLSFASWMGGDRDGNPFVTSKVTKEVLLSSRWQAMDLYHRDLEELCSELSIVDATEALKANCGDASEPYRAVLRKLRDDVETTRDYLTSQLTGAENDSDEDLITHTEQLLQPLQLCYDSLVEKGLTRIADGKLRDAIWRVHAFGAPLQKLDIRQDSDRHSDVFAELTRYLGLGDYGQWSETDKQAFLLRELSSKRPLIPSDWQPSEEVQEVLDTCRLIAQTDPKALGIYIISMARFPSDVLAVQLLLQECGCKFRMPVAPLFETLDDLNRSESVIRELLQHDWYRGYLQGKQYVMIGYSDSAKDAGFFAAGWAQYRAQEALVTIAEEHGQSLILFHGRGGTVGRGGAPAHQALLSQPPGSLKAGLRVTEQGEMIRFKYGLSELAVQSLSRFVSAVLEGNLLPPPKPKQEWRDLMDRLSETSCDVYRGVVRENADFVPYFRAATPEQELGKLPLGSRPSKRRPGGVESLRAIPWIFAWSQNRMMLPAWLGTGEALKQVRDDGFESTLLEMNQDWPFFHTRLAMLEMVFTKTDPWLASLYDEKLVPEEQRALGNMLRDRLQSAIDQVVELIPSHRLMEEDPQIQASIQFRNPYIDPLNILQVELLLRSRKCEDDETSKVIEKALMVTISGVAAGLRNTG